MTTIALRAATAEDIPTILGLVRELAEYERDPDAVVATPELMHHALFGPSHVAYALMAEESEDAGSGGSSGDSVTLGFALYFFNFSTWTGRKGLYLEDFYVRPPARGRGVGEKLFIQLARVALQHDCGRMELSVLNWNVNAIRLYERLGGEAKSDWTTYRFGPNEIAAVAGRGTDATEPS